MRTPRLRSLLLAATFAVLSASARAEIVPAIEFYHAQLDHYFVSASATEIAALDNGVFKGWARTGLSFGVYPAGDTTPGTTPVCRFYGNPAYGLDSHFYSASPAECAEVQQKWPEQWLLESNEVFRVVLPDATTGYCRSGTEPLFRIFNQRTDVNHRYLTNYGEMAATLDRGYVMEGYGTPPVAMCVPYPPLQIAVAQCEIDVQHSEPVATEANRLTARCTNHPKSFVWTGCTSNSGVCYMTSATPGPVTYSVVATNEVGNSVPATRTLNWEARPPRCGIAATTFNPSVGVPQTLYESCDGNPTAFFWTNCESKGDTCIANASSPGPQTYTLYAANAWGTGAATTETLNWQEQSQSVTPVCNVSVASYSGSLVTLQATCSGEPYNYLWTNCASTAAVCTASPPAISPITYTVRGVNAFGAGTPASVTVIWPQAKPVCTLTASSPTPYTDTQLTLTAICSGNPTRYEWVGCTPASGNTCTDVVDVGIPKGYMLIAHNDAGESNLVTIGVNWQPGPVPPRCELSASYQSPRVGTEVLLVVACKGGSPTSFVWVNCTSGTGTCVATSTVPGPVAYTMYGVNAYGSSPPATVQVTWLP